MSATSPTARASSAHRARSRDPLEREIANAERRASRRAARIRELERELEIATRAREDDADRIARLETENSDRTLTLALEERRAGDLEASLAEANDREAEARQQRDEVRRHAVGLERRLAEIDRLQAELRAECASLTARVEARDAQVAALSEALAATRQSLAAVQQALARCEESRARAACNAPARLSIAPPSPVAVQLAPEPTPNQESRERVELAPAAPTEAPPQRSETAPETPAAQVEAVATEPAETPVELTEVISTPPAEDAPAPAPVGASIAVRADRDWEGLPAVHRSWRAQQVRSKLRRAGVRDVGDFYLDALIERCRKQPDACHRVLSVSTGARDAEVLLARSAREAGVRNFNLHCLSPAASTLTDDRAIAAEPALTEHLTLVQADLRHWHPAEPYPIVIAHQSLHRLAEPEAALAKLRTLLADDGRLLASTPIGRWDRMESPLAAEIVEQVWQLLPERCRYDRSLRLLERRYDEAPGAPDPAQARAAALLPQLMAAFHFEVFIPYGCVINAFIDAEIGPNFDPNSESDRRFIEQVAALDDEKIDSGVYAPTHLLAALRKDPVDPPVTFRHWSPTFCLGRAPRADTRSADGDAQAENTVER